MKYFLPLFLFAVVFIPQALFAAELPAQVGEIPSDIVSCKNGGECDFCDFMTMVQTINKWVLGISLMIGVIILMYAGYRITAARGEVGIVTEARKLIGNVAIGIIIIVTASFLVDILMKTTTGGEYGWWNPPSNEKCGIQEDTKGLVDKKIKTGTHTGITIPSDTTAWDDPTTGGSSYVNEAGQIDVILPGTSAPPAYEADKYGPQ